MTSPSNEAREAQTAAGQRLMAEYREWFATQGWEREGWDAEKSAAALELDIAAIEADAARAALLALAESLAPVEESARNEPTLEER